MRQQKGMEATQGENASLGILLFSLGKNAKRTLPGACLNGDSASKSTKKLPTYAWLAIKPSYMLSRIGNAGRSATLARHPRALILLFSSRSSKDAPRFFLQVADWHKKGPASITRASKRRGETLYGIRAPGTHATPHATRFIYREQPTRNAIYNNAPTRKRPTQNIHSIVPKLFRRVLSNRKTCDPDASVASLDHPARGI